VADAFADLLEIIVRDYAITDAQKDVDLNARPRRQSERGSCTPLSETVS
jgi:hypothetical protein